MRTPSWPNQFMYLLIFSQSIALGKSNLSLPVTHGGVPTPFKITIVNVIAEWLLVEKTQLAKLVEDWKCKTRQQLCYLWSCQWLTQFFLTVIKNGQFNFPVQLLPTMSSGIWWWRNLNEWHCPGCWGVFVCIFFWKPNMLWVRSSTCINIL